MNESAHHGQEYSKGILSAERIERLNAIGFEWRLRRRRGSVKGTKT